MSDVAGLQNGETARFWRHPTSPSLDMLTARFIDYRYDRHIHDTYAIAVIEAGVEEYLIAGETERAGPGAVVVVPPGVVHTGHAGAPEGWRYRVLYPDTQLVGEVARELGVRGSPAFTRTTEYVPGLWLLIRRAHHAAEAGDTLAASALLRSALGRLIADLGSQRTVLAGTDPELRDVRDMLHSRLTDPPTLEELAAAVGSSTFSVLRAFRRAYGLPPHAYLNQVRVQKARALLRRGLKPAETAYQVGFADQAHLTRHFKRTVGVTPGAYQRGVQ